jgi:hypothetical protein
MNKKIKSILENLLFLINVAVFGAGVSAVWFLILSYIFKINFIELDIMLISSAIVIFIMELIAISTLVRNKR